MGGMSGPMFQPRGTRSKRHLVLPQVRVDEQEMQAVQWLMQRQSAKYGKDLSIADLLRLAIDHLYQAEQAEAAAETEKSVADTTPTAGPLVT